MNYTGTGGRGKVSASAQLNLPLPLGPQWGANVFLDAGQVFRPSTVPTTLLLRASGNPADAQLADILDREGGFRAGAGAGSGVRASIAACSAALLPSLGHITAPGATPLTRTSGPRSSASERVIAASAALAMQYSG